MNLPSDSLGVVAYAAKDLRVEPVSLPEPAAERDRRRGGLRRGLRLRPAHWTHGAAGESILRAPMVLGHEVVGTVVRAAADGSGPTVGTEVAVHPASPAGDGVTRYPADRPNLSPGCTYLGSAARYPHTDGAFVKYATLPSRMLRPLPAGLGPTGRGPGRTGLGRLARRLPGRRRAKTRRHWSVGAGPIGALVVAVLKRAGASEITAVDMHDLPLENARKLGATRTLLSTQADEIAAVQADIVVESSGSHRGLASAFRGATLGGRVVMVGTAAQWRATCPHLPGHHPRARTGRRVPLQRRDRRGDRRLGRRQPLHRPHRDPRVRCCRRTAGVRGGPGRGHLFEGPAAVLTRAHPPLTLAPHPHHVR